jgi:hypothetical protein
MWLVPLLVLAWITKINSNKWQIGPCSLQNWTAQLPHPAVASLDVQALTVQSTRSSGSWLRMTHWRLSPAASKLMRIMGTSRQWCRTTQAGCTRTGTYSRASGTLPVQHSPYTHSNLPRWCCRRRQVCSVHSRCWSIAPFEPPTRRRRLRLRTSGVRRGNFLYVLRNWGPS